MGATLAERMAALAEWMFERTAHPLDDFHATAWQLDGEDANLDHLTNTFYTRLAPADTRRKCAAADFLRHALVVDVVTSC